MHVRVWASFGRQVKRERVTGRRSAEARERMRGEFADMKKEGG